MAAYLRPIWDSYLEHRSLNLLREEVLTDPWYEAPKTANESLLMRAVEWRDAEAVKLLLSIGADPRLPAPDGFTFLHQAVDEIDRIGAGLQSECDEISPGRDAAIAVLESLLKCGTDPNVLGADGTPLHRAAGSGVVATARLLLSYGADIEARMLIDGGLTPLMHAAAMGHPEMVRFLLDSGADRSAIIRTSLIYPSMTLRELVLSHTRTHKEEILRLLER